MYLRELKNKRIAKGFDRLAPLYTGMSRIVFGKTLARAQQHFLTSIRAGDHILILGGGSGDFLNSVLKHQPNITIDYIDISEKMIQLARENTQHPAAVNFITGTEQHIPDRTYSVVITNFYLDLFSDNTLSHIVQKIKSHLQPQGRWLVTDFANETWWHSVMLWAMYRFFRLTTGIEAKRLPEWQRCLATAVGGNPIHKKFYNGFVMTTVFTGKKYKRSML